MVRPLELSERQCCVIQVQTCYGMFLRSLEHSSVQSRFFWLPQPPDIRIEDCRPAARVTLLLLEHFLDWITIVFCLPRPTAPSLISCLLRLQPSPVGEVKTGSQRTRSLKELFLRGGEPEGTG